MKPCDETFQRDVAEQLSEAGRVLAATGLSWSVKTGQDEVVLELASPGTEDAAFLIVAVFNDGTLYRPGWGAWLQLCAENGDTRYDLLTLAWLEDNSDQAMIDPSLPLAQRGLNAAADVREGRYERGNPLRMLTQELRALSRSTGYQPGTALSPLPGSGKNVPAVARARPVDARQQSAAVDAEFETPASLTALPAETPASARRVPSLAEINERLIAEVLHAMQQDLARLEARFVGMAPGSSLKAKLVELLEWAMLAVAYATEAKTNQRAIASFIPGDGASWLYGLVGPVLIGGLASLTKSKAGKAAAFGLMAAWALAMATVTASNREYLDGAQGWFPKGPAVLAHEKALALARLDVAADEKEVGRLEGKPGTNTASLVADARKRWQAKELQALGEKQQEREAAALAAAKAVLKQAQARVSDEEFGLREALLNDESRLWAWRSLFLIFGVINFAAPFAISRVIEKWRDEHAAAKNEAQDDHVAREEAKALRHGRPAQKARAVTLLGAAMAGLEGEGVPADLLDQLNGSALAGTTADRFDRIVNPGKYGKRFRLWAPSQT